MTENQGKYSRKSFIGTLIIAGLSVSISNYIITLFAVDIAQTFFGSTDAVALASVTQLTTINSIVEIILALCMTFLALRIRHKRLLLTGSLLVLISAIGSIIAPNLLTLQAFYALEGAGSIIAGIMMYTIIGDFLPHDTKVKAIGYINAIGALGALIIVAFLTLATNIGGWRFGFTAIALPFSLISCILTLIIIPTPPRKTEETKVTPYLSSLRLVFKNKSATACLIANILTVAGAQVAIFATSFYRTKFGLSSQWVGLIYATAIVLFIIAPLVASKLVNRFGAKRMSIATGLLASVFVLIFFFVPNLYVAVILDMAHVWFAASAVVAFASLIIDQVPNYRATMMSLNSIFNNIGNVIAAAFGGFLLFLTNGLFGAVGLALGISTLFGVAIIIFFASDPIRSN
jgi:predicted MFS family arabinose efflux permease